VGGPPAGSLRAHLLIRTAHSGRQLLTLQRRGLRRVLSRRERLGHLSMLALRAAAAG
jgi:hypothetical protein